MLKSEVNLVNTIVLRKTNLYFQFSCISYFNPKALTDTLPVPTLLADTLIAPVMLFKITKWTETGYVVVAPLAVQLICFRQLHPEKLEKLAVFPD